MIRQLCALAGLLLLAACGGGGGGGSAAVSSSPPVTTSPPPPALTNVATITVDAGPAALDTGPNAYISDNTAFVSVTLCAPGSTTNCQTIDHVIVDTGSVGLRVFQSVLTPALLAALPTEADANANPVGECYAFIDGFIFGSVRQANFQIGGENVADMPLQVIGDTGAFSAVPSSCSSGGGPNLDTVQAFGANGVIGIGVTTTDCGTFCQSPGGFAAATYYDCPSSGCASIITRTASTIAPFQQLPNPVAAMSVDNNGTIISLPTAPAAGETSLSGTLIFGIGTETNNALGAATVLTTTLSSNPNGAGLITAMFNGQNLDESFLDSGSDAFFFADSAIALCTNKNFTGFYCPSSTLSLNATLEGLNGVSAGAPFSIGNAQNLFSGDFSVIPDLGANPSMTGTITPFPDSFDFGLPFFFGRNVYTAIEGLNAGGATGPYFAY
jgi:Protein of unknown function (DUF3443)